MEEAGLKFELVAPLAAMDEREFRVELARWIVDGWPETRSSAVRHLGDVFHLKIGKRTVNLRCTSTPPRHR